MNASLSPIFVECLGWTLVHFLWQGAVVAALLAGGLRLLRRSSANRRYLSGCLGLLVLSLAPAITFRHILGQYPLSQAPARELISAPAVVDSIAPETKPPTKLIFIAKSAIHELNFAQRLAELLPWVVIGWAAGVFALSCQLLMGWRQIARLKRNAVTTLDETWLGRLAELGWRMGVDRPVRLVESALVEVPTVIGWLRPIILLPTSCLVGLTPAQLESILAHELAHIRRHDYLVNLLQSVVETILFYHPAVWWVSRQVREERENCCDDLAVEICGDRIAYARALATLEELRPAPAQFALAAGGAPLLQRIQRLVGQSRKNPNRPGWPVAGVIALLLIALLAMSLRGNRAVAGGDESAPTNTIRLGITNNVSTIAGSSIKTSTNTTRQSILSKLVHIHVDSIKYDGLPLGEVINNLSEIAKSHDPEHVGINFFIDKDLAPPASRLGAIDPANGLSVSTDPSHVTVKINPALNNVRLADVLNAIVKAADQPIKYSVLDYAVLFSLRGQETVPLELRTFRVDPASFRLGLGKFLGVPLGDVSNNRTNQNTELQLLVRRFFISVGIDVSTNNGNMFVFNDRKGILTVRATSQDLEKIDDAIQKMMAPEINIKVKFVEIGEALSPHPGLNWFFNDNAGHSPANPAPDSNPLMNYRGPSNAPVTAKFPVTNSIISQFTGILTRKQFETAIAVLEQRDGVDELTAPEVTTGDGRQAQIQAVDIITVVTGRNLSLDDKGRPVTTFSTQQLPFGPVLDVIPHVSANRKATELTLIATITEFQGYSQGAAGKTLTLQPVFSKGVEPVPHIRLRQMTTAATVLDGDTIVLGGVEAERLISMTDKVSVLGDIPLIGGLFRSTSFRKTRKNLLVFVTPTLINHDGSRFHKEDETSPTPNEIPPPAPTAK